MINSIIKYFLSCFKITEEDLPRSWKDGKLHYHLIGKANGVQKETQVLLDLRPGTVFIQTDKPIYKPDEKGKLIYILRPCLYEENTSPAFPEADR